MQAYNPFVGKDRFVRVTPDNVSGLHNEPERVVAQYYLEKGAKVFRNIPLGGREIDFFVLEPVSVRGTLIEVSRAPRDQALRGHSKKEQIMAMKTLGNGRNWMLYCREELDEIISNSNGSIT